VRCVFRGLHFAVGEPAQRANVRIPDTGWAAGAQSEQPMSDPRNDQADPVGETGAEPAVLDALRSVYDPCCREKGISIVDMGLGRSLQVEDGLTRVELLLTSGWCPFASRMLSEARQVVEALPAAGEVSIDVVWN